MDGMAQWLSSIGLGDYASVFQENDIDFEVLPELTVAELETLGLSLGHRKKLMRAIAALGTRAPEPTNIAAPGACRRYRATRRTGASSPSCSSIWSARPSSRTALTRR